MTVDGVQISLELLKCLANPNPHRLYTLKRIENTVHCEVFTTLDDKRHVEALST